MAAIEWAVMILSIGFVATSVLVLMSKKLIVAISAIGVGTVLLAAIFFIFGAPYAGAFELSIGAGLMSVLFIIATSLSNRAIDEVE